MPYAPSGSNKNKTKQQTMTAGMSLGCCMKNGSAEDGFGILIFRLWDLRNNELL
jgi:hypothetical protein